MSQRGGAEPASSGNTECVQVVIRCRPMSEQEVADERRKAVFMDTNRGEVSVHNLDDGNAPPRRFTFDRVYDESSKQYVLYQECAHSIVESVMEGINGTIFAYGQTGSGKTHTMEGKGSMEERGIIPNAFADIFRYISQHSHKQFLVRVSFLEIYMEEIYDLLSKRKQCELHEDKQRGVFVKDLTSIGIKNERETAKVLEVGKKNRKSAATAMNPFSSRSHSVFTITVESSEVWESDGKQHVRVGKLNLVDLAGSERQKKTHAEGERFKEATQINWSLTALANVIKALTRKGGKGHIPYRESKLTRILQDSLGGNTKTMMIATVGPADYNISETTDTLRYAERAKSIKNKPRVNEDPKDAMIREFQSEIDRLRKQLESQQAGGAAGGSGANPEVYEQQLREREEEHKRRMAEIVAQQAQLAEQERAVITEEKGKVEAELKEAESRLKQQQKTLEKERKQLERERREREEQSKKLEALENQVLVGGTNLLEKAREQEEMLRMATQEIESHRREQVKIQQALQQREAELDEHRERFQSLQEEVEFRTRQLKEVHKRLQAKTEEMDIQLEEFEEEREELQETINDLLMQVKLQKAQLEAFVAPNDLEAARNAFAWSDELNDWVMVRPVASQQQKELMLKDLIIDHFVPPSEVQKILARAQWDDEQKRYVMISADVAGNPVRDQRPRSTFGLKRPTTAFAQAHVMSGNVDPRFRTENILDLEPEMLGRNTLNLGASSGEHYQDASYLDDADVYSDDPLAGQQAFAAAPMGAYDVRAYGGGGSGAAAAASSSNARPSTARGRASAPASTPYGSYDAAYDLQQQQQQQLQQQQQQQWAGAGQAQQQPARRNRPMSASRR